MTDANQNVVWTMHQTPFGEFTAANDSNFHMPMRFPGQYADLESGYSYNYFRDYDPSLGRYIQSDPIGLRGGVNVFSYVNQQPTQSYDPLGLCLRQLTEDVRNNGSGVRSYFEGIYGTLRYSVRRSGLLGEEERVRSVVEGVVLASILIELSRNENLQKQAIEQAAGQLTENKSKVTGRFEAGAIVSVTLARAVSLAGGGLGFALNVAAINGNLRTAVENGVTDQQGVVAALLLGE